jgi:uncharacterized membrane protein (DUF485 family)
MPDHEDITEKGLPQALSFVRQFHMNPNDVQASPKVQSIDIHSDAFLHTLMRRQLRLSIACAATFVIALLGLPLANYFLPELMAKRIFGFTLTWMILGVLFFPFVWIISYTFIKRSIALEEDEVKSVVSTSK